MAAWTAPSRTLRRQLLPAWLLLLALADWPMAARAQSSCESNPTVEACRTYAVPDAVLQRDLASLCGAPQLGSATYTGWPAACTLWHECQQGRAAATACQPLSLLQTACNETPEAQQCMT
jgi:hypothetical protein